MLPNKENVAVAGQRVCGCLQIRIYSRIAICKVLKECKEAGHADTSEWRPYYANKINCMMTFALLTNMLETNARGLLLK